MAPTYSNGQEMVSVFFAIKWLFYDPSLTHKGGSGGKSDQLRLRDPNIATVIGNPLGVFHNRNPSNLDSDLDSLD